MFQNRPNHDWLAGFPNHEQLGCIDRGLSKGPQQCRGGSYQPDGTVIVLIWKSVEVIQFPFPNHDLPPPDLGSLDVIFSKHGERAVQNLYWINFVKT